MNNKPVSFQLEKTVPGTFLMQGLWGGVLGGFVAAFIGAVAWDDNTFDGTLQLTTLSLFAGGIIGMIKGTLMWGGFRLTGIQYRAMTRVAVTGILTALAIAVMGRQADFDDGFLRGCLIWALSLGIPVALLVGSRVKPWKLFTFGSIAAGEVDQRSGSRSVLATLATLPLRFLSITAYVLLLLYSTAEFARARDTGEVFEVILFLSIAGFYPLISAYVTFRSPRKIVLSVIGAVINAPIMLVSLLSFREYFQTEPVEKVLIYALVSGSFVIAWVMFLVARLSVKISPVRFLTICNNKSIGAAPNLDHHCLGSRFAEWQQRVA